MASLGCGLDSQDPSMSRLPVQLLLPNACLLRVTFLDPLFQATHEPPPISHPPSQLYFPLTIYGHLIGLDIHIFKVFLYLSV